MSMMMLSLYRKGYCYFDVLLVKSEIYVECLDVTLGA